MSASSIRKFLLSTEKMVEASLSTSRTVVKMASGPLKMVSIAACGTYVTANMKTVTPNPSEMVGTSLAARGRHSVRFAQK